MRCLSLLFAAGLLVLPYFIAPHCLVLADEAVTSLEDVKHLVEKRNPTLKQYTQEIKAAEV